MPRKATGGRTQAQRKSIAKKNPSRAVKAADKKITKLNKGIAGSGSGRRAADNNHGRTQAIGKLNRAKGRLR